MCVGKSVAGRKALGRLDLGCNAKASHLRAKELRNAMKRRMTLPRAALAEGKATADKHPKVLIRVSQIPPTWLTTGTHA